MDGQMKILGMHFLLGIPFLNLTNKFRKNSSSKSLFLKAFKHPPNKSVSKPNKPTKSIDSVQFGLFSK